MPQRMNMKWDAEIPMDAGAIMRTDIYRSPQGAKSGRSEVAIRAGFDRPSPVLAPILAVGE